MTMDESIRETAFMARAQLWQGRITYEEAKEKIQPFIDCFNAISTEKAKKYHLRARRISFSSFIR